MKYKLDLIAWFFERVYRYKNKLNIYFYNPLVHFICFIKGVKTGKKVNFRGFPMFRRYENSAIYFGDNCVLNSSRNSVRIGLQRPCVFITLAPEAEITFGHHSGATGSTFVAYKKISIGNNVLIGTNTMILDNDFHNADPSKRLLSSENPARPVIIEDNVFVGTNSLILKGVTIGENSVIGANSVVINNIPKNAIAIGNPCKVVVIKNWSSSSK
jgi:acetyltransferase-like isoleucine patch superfamily enzyme